MAEWTEIPEGKGLEPGEVRGIRLNGSDLALCRDGDEVYLLENRCPHRGGQLSDGRVLDGRVICPLHGWDFDLKTGVSPYNPDDRVRTCTVRRRAGKVEVDVESVPAMPEGGHRSHYQGKWRRFGDDVEEDYELLHGYAAGGHDVVEAMRTTRPVQGFNEIQFAAGQLARPPRLDAEPVDLQTRLGRSAKRPLELAMPLLVSHMSFGALSAEAKVALATASATAGIAICSGEGGMLPAERAAAGGYILEMASGYFGWTEENIKQADGVEIKIGQASKAGAGGLLPGAKVTAEIAAVRGIEPGTAAHSPARFADLDAPGALGKRVREIREMTDGRPVGIKFAAGDVEADLALALEAGPDCVTIDGRPGGTGAAPLHLKDHVGVPTVFAIDRARAFMEREGVRGLDLVATGGLRTAADYAKALALGADVVAIATAAMIGIGCQQYRVCHTGNCPVGIATQRQDLRARFDVGIAAEMAERLFATVRGQLEDYCRILGRGAAEELAPEDLVTANSEISGHTAVRHA